MSATPISSAAPTLAVETPGAAPVSSETAVTSDSTSPSSNSCLGSQPAQVPSVNVEKSAAQSTSGSNNSSATETLTLSDSRTKTALPDRSIGGDSTRAPAVPTAVSKALGVPSQQGGSSTSGTAVNAPQNGKSNSAASGSSNSSAATEAAAGVSSCPEAWREVEEAADEEKLVSALSEVLQELNRKGSRLGLTKAVVVAAGRRKRNMIGKTGGAWTRNVAKVFGAVLKRANKVEQLTQQRLEDAQKYGSLFGSLQEFGCLHGDDYSTVRIVRMGGLVPSARFVSIACGGQHACALTTDGQVYSWGAGSFGQLGNGSRAPVSSPQQILELPTCKRVACGYAYSCAVTAEGNIMSWGAGENGRLGNGATHDVAVPVSVDTTWNAVDIFAGSVHTCAIAESGEMYTWGHKNYTGHGADADVVSPRLLDKFDGKLMHSASIGPGGYHTIALSESGDVYTWGHNRVGQLGFENDDVTHKTKEGAYFYPHPCLVRALTGRPVRQVAAGWGHSMVLCWDGDVLACGRNYRGQLGRDPSLCDLNERGHPYSAQFTQVQSLAGIKIERIACGGEHSAAVSDEGSLYLWGDDSCGQLAHAQELTSVYESAVHRSHFKAHASRVQGEPSVQGVMDMALGSAVSLVIMAEDE